MKELLYKEEAFKVAGICMNLYKARGMGLKEINYKDAMEIDFTEAGIPFERAQKFIVKYIKTKSCEMLIMRILLLSTP